MYELLTRMNRNRRYDTYRDLFQVIDIYREQLFVNVRDTIDDFNIVSGLHVERAGVSP